MPHKDPEKKKEYFRMYREKNRDKINARIRKWSKGEEASRKKQEYREKNRETAREYHKEYRQTEYRKNYLKNFFKNYYVNRSFKDHNYKMRIMLRNRIYKALNNQLKADTTMKLIGCSMEELWQHLESQFQPGMTRKNHGKWHIDHIKPCISFDLTDPKQQAKCFHYTNLQPLWSIDNLKKGGKYENNDRTRS